MPTNNTATGRPTAPADGAAADRSSKYINPHTTLTDSVRFSMGEIQRLLNATSFSYAERKTLADSVLSLWTAVTLLAMERLSPWGKRRFVKDLPRAWVSKVGNSLVEGIRPLPKPPETDVEIEDQRVLDRLGVWTHWLTFIASIRINRAWRHAAWEDRPGLADDLIALLTPVSESNAAE